MTEYCYIFEILFSIIAPSDAFTGPYYSGTVFNLMMSKKLHGAALPMNDLVFSTAQMFQVKPFFSELHSHRGATSD